MSRRRQAIRAYARQWLGVERLPRGVPAQLDELVKAMGDSPVVPPSAIYHILGPHRKPMWLL